MRWKERLFLIVTLIILFTGLETAARLVLHRIPLWNRLPGASDLRYKMWWIERHSADTTIYYTFDIYHPQRGWALEPGLRDVPLEWGETLNSNSRGIRGIRETSYDRSPGIKRMLVLGDSFTFGDEVGDDETIPACLESALPGWEVINMGVHGYGHDQMLLYFEEEGIKYRPDVVALVFLNMDILRNMLSFRDYAKPRFERRAGRLVLTNVPVPTPDETLRRHRIGPRLLDLARIAWEARHRFTGSSAAAKRHAAARQLTSEIMIRLLDRIKAIDAEPLWIFLPAPKELEGPGEELTSHDDYFEVFCCSHDVLYISLLPFFVPRAEELLSPEGLGEDHWRAPVNQLAAELTAQHMARHLSGRLD